MQETWVQSLGWEGKSYPLQYSGLENSIDCIVHEVSKSWALLSLWFVSWIVNPFFWLLLQRNQGIEKQTCTNFYWDHLNRVNYWDTQVSMLDIISENESVSHSVMSDSLQLQGLQHPAFPVLTISWSLLKFMSIGLVTPFDHLILCGPLFFLPSIFPSIRVCSNELAFPIRPGKIPWTEKPGGL